MEGITGGREGREERGPALTGRGGWRVVRCDGLPWRVSAVPTLGQFQRWMALAVKEGAVVEAIDRLGLEEGDVTTERNLLLLELAEVYMAMARVVLHPSDAEALDNLSLRAITELAGLLDFTDEPAVAEVAAFDFPPAMLPADRVPWSPFREGRERHRLWKKGAFITAPLLDLPLASRNTTDAVRRGWKGTPKAAKTEMAELVSRPEDLAARVSLDRMIRRYADQGEEELFRNMHVIISHVCLPAHSPRYDFDKAQERAESFRHLPLATAKGVAGFFSTAATVSKTSISRTFSMLARKWAGA